MNKTLIEQTQFSNVDVFIDERITTLSYENYLEILQKVEVIDRINTLFFACVVFGVLLIVDDLFKLKRAIQTKNKKEIVLSIIGLLVYSFIIWYAVSSRNFILSLLGL